MTFLKVLEVTKPRHTGTISLRGANFRFARISHPLKHNLQQECFGDRWFYLGILPKHIGQFCPGAPRLVRQQPTANMHACFEKFMKSRFIDIGKSTITLYISSMPEEKKIFYMSLKICSNQRFVLSTGALR